MAGPATFEPGPANPQPFSFDIHTRPPNDASAKIDGEPLAKLTGLRQRRTDLFAQTPTFEEGKDLRDSVVRHQNRVNDLTRHRSLGGFGLDPETAPQVINERHKLERAEKELARLTALKDARSARATVTGQLERAVTEWLTAGVPGNCVLEPVEDPPLSQLLIKADGGRLDAAVVRYRQQLETHAKALAALKAAPFTRVEVLAAIGAEINSRADAAMPDITRVVRFLEPIRFATTFSHRLAENLDPKVPPTLIGSETTDILGTFCWMFRQELITKLQAMAPENDGEVSKRDREVQEAQLSEQILEIERREVACIWAAEARGEIIDFRADTSPQSLLGVCLAFRPHAPPSGTSPEHAYNVVRR
jgi:hypothetical protein